MSRRGAKKDSVKREKRRKFRLPRIPRIKKRIYKKGFPIGRDDFLNRFDWLIVEPSTGPLGKHPKLAGSSTEPKGGSKRISVVNTRSTVLRIARYYKGFRRGGAWGQSRGRR